MFVLLQNNTCIKTWLITPIMKPEVDGVKTNGAGWESLPGLNVHKIGRVGISLTICMIIAWYPTTLSNYDWRFKSLHHSHACMHAPAIACVEHYHCTFSMCIHVLAQLYDDQHAVKQAGAFTCDLTA